MSYLVDTDRVTDWLVGRPDATELLARLSLDGLSVSLITFGEVYEGIYFGRDSRASERGFRRFLLEVDVLPLSRAIMQRFAQVRGDLRRRGQLIGDTDILIAATAIQHDLTLLTRNTRHFERIANLKLYQPN